MENSCSDTHSDAKLFPTSNVLCNVTNNISNDIDKKDVNVTSVLVANEMLISWYSQQVIISYDTYLLMENTALCWVNPMLLLVGAPTNFVNCLVFFRQNLRDRMNLCLFSLALVDLLFVTFFYLVGSYCHVNYFLPETAVWWKYFTRVNLTGLYRGFLYSSGCLTMIIAIERCVCVTWPMRAATLIKTRTMAAMIVSTVALIEIGCIVYPLELAVGSRKDPMTNETSLFLSSTQFYSDNRVTYAIVEDTILMVVIPFSTFGIVAIATTITVIQLNRAVTWRKNSSSSDKSRREKALVKMLVIVSCIYIVTAAPNIALGLTRTLIADFRHTTRYGSIFMASHLFYLVLGMFNSSVSFFVYVTRSSRFRQELYHLVQRCDCTRKLPFRFASFKKSLNASFDKETTAFA